MQRPAVLGSLGRPREGGGKKRWGAGRGKAVEGRADQQALGPTAAATIQTPCLPTCSDQRPAGGSEKTEVRYQDKFWIVVLLQVCNTY